MKMLSANTTKRWGPGSDKFNGGIHARYMERAPLVAAGADRGDPGDTDRVLVKLFQADQPAARLRSFNHESDCDRIAGALLAGTDESVR